MENKFKVLGIFIFLTSTIYSQQNISLDSDCLLKNSARLSHAVIMLKGKEVVSDILDNNQRFLLLCKLDTVGNVIELMEPVRGNYPIDEDFKQELITFFHSNYIYFYRCIYPIPGFSEAESYERIRKRIADNPSDTDIVTIGFPGELISGYTLEKEKAEKKGECLTKFDFIQKQIHRYYD